MTHWVLPGVGRCPVREPARGHPRACVKHTQLALFQALPGNPERGRNSGGRELTREGLTLAKPLPTSDLHVSTGERW